MSRGTESEDIPDPPPPIDEEEEEAQKSDAVKEVSDSPKRHHHRKSKGKTVEEEGDKEGDKGDKEKHHKHHKSKHSGGHSRKEAAAAEEAAKAALFETPPTTPRGRMNRTSSFSALISSLRPHSRTSSVGGDIVEPTPVLHQSESTVFSDILKDVPEQDGETIGSRSQHKKNKSFQVNAVGEVVYKKHPSWVLMHQMQIGIYHSLCYTVPRLVENAIRSGFLKKRPSRVMDEDPCITNHAFYETPEILRFPATGSTLHSTPPHKLGDFKFKDYCPLAFRWIRAFFGITSPLEFLGSLCGYHVNKLDGSTTGEEEGNPLRLMGTPGKSGSLFFFTEDMKYCIKTIPKHEAKLLRRILPPYVKHLNDNPNTLLPRFYGLYRVKPHRGSQVRFVVMSNLFATNLLIHERFDLKGSDVGRYTSQAERARKGRLATLKEHNWKEMKRSILFTTPASATMTSDTCSKALFMEQLRRDTQFLAEQGLMDYSLLVGLHYHKLKNNDKTTGKIPETRSRAASSDGLTTSSASVRKPKTIAPPMPPDISSFAVSLPSSPRGALPPDNPPLLVISESMIKKSKHPEEEASETESKSEKRETRTNSAAATTPSGLKEERPKPKRSNGKSEKKKKRKKSAAVPETDAAAAATPTAAAASSSSPVSDVTVTTTTTTTSNADAASSSVTSPASSQSSMKMPRAAHNPKLSLSAIAAAGAAAEAQAAQSKKKKGIEDEDDADCDASDDGVPHDVALGGDERNEFLTMRMNLQPHTGRVEQFDVDGLGEVDVVTMPFEDYSIQERDLWPEFGTPQAHYNNLWYRDNGGMYSGINGISYFFGIIDILMVYTPKKSLERRFKTIRYHGQGEVSSCPPNRYAVRFLSFINSATL